MKSATARAVARREGHKAFIDAAFPVDHDDCEPPAVARPAQRNGGYDTALLSSKLVDDMSFIGPVTDAQRLPIYFKRENTEPGNATRFRVTFAASMSLHELNKQYGQDLPRGPGDLRPGSRRCFVIPANLAALHSVAYMERPDLWGSIKEPRNGLRAYVHDITQTQVLNGLGVNCTYVPFCLTRPEIQWNRAVDDNNTLTLRDVYGSNRDRDLNILFEFVSAAFPDYELPWLSAAAARGRARVLVDSHQQVNKTNAKVHGSPSVTSDATTTTVASAATAPAAAAAIAATVNNDESAPTRPSKYKMMMDYTAKQSDDQSKSAIASSGAMFADPTQLVHPANLHRRLQGSPVIYIKEVSFCHVPTNGSKHHAFGPFADGHFICGADNQVYSAVSLSVFSNMRQQMIIRNEGRDARTGRSRAEKDFIASKRAEKLDDDSNKVDVLKELGASEAQAIRDELLDMDRDVRHSILAMCCDVEYYTELFASGQKKELDQYRATMAPIPAASLDLNKRIPITMKNKGRQFSFPQACLLLTKYRLHMRKLRKENSGEHDAEWQTFVSSIATSHNGEILYFTIPRYPTLSLAIRDLQETIPRESIVNMDTLAIKVIPDDGFDAQKARNEHVTIVVCATVTASMIHPYVSDTEQFAIDRRVTEQIRKETASR